MSPEKGGRDGGAMGGVKFRVVCSFPADGCGSSDSTVIASACDMCIRQSRRLHPMTRLSDTPPLPQMAFGIIIILIHILRLPFFVTLLCRSYVLFSLVAGDC